MKSVVFFVVFAALVAGIEGQVSNTSTVFESFNGSTTALNTGSVTAVTAVTTNHSSAGSFTHSTGNDSTATTKPSVITNDTTMETAFTSGDLLTTLMTGETSPISMNTSTACTPQSRGFDAASFVGGIVLALGIMAILVIIVKCYYNKVRKSELQYSQF